MEESLMKIAYWSMFHGQTRTTTNLLLVHSWNGLDKDKKQVILSNQFSYNLLDNYLGIAKDRTIGLDKLIIATRNKSLISDHISDYCISLLQDSRLDLIPGTMHSRESAHSNVDEIFVGLVELANKVYDDVIIDVNAGYSDFNKMILEEADRVVVNICQNKFLIEETLEMVEKLKIKDKSIFVLGDYHESSKYSSKNIERQYKIKIAGAIPGNKNVQNAINNSSIIDFVNINEEAQEHDDNYEVINQIKSISKAL